MICPFCSKDLHKHICNDNTYYYQCSPHLYVHYENNKIYTYGANDGTYGINCNAYYKESSLLIKNTYIKFPFFIEPEIVNNTPAIDKIINRLIKMRAFI